MEEVGTIRSLHALPPLQEISFLESGYPLYTTGPDDSFDHLGLLAYTTLAAERMRLIFHKRNLWRPKKEDPPGEPWLGPILYNDHDTPVEIILYGQGVAHDLYTSTATGEATYAFLRPKRKILHTIKAKESYTLYRSGLLFGLSITGIIEIEISNTLHLGLWSSQDHVVPQTWPTATSPWLHKPFCERWGAVRLDLTQTPYAYQIGTEKDDVFGQRYQILWYLQNPFEQTVLASLHLVSKEREFASPVVAEQLQMPPRPLRPLEDAWLIDQIILAPQQKHVIPTRLMASPSCYLHWSFKFID